MEEKYAKRLRKSYFHVLFFLFSDFGGRFTQPKMINSSFEKRSTDTDNETFSINCLTLISNRLSEMHVVKVSLSQ